MFRKISTALAALCFACALPGAGFAQQAQRQPALYNDVPPDLAKAAYFYDDAQLKQDGKMMAAILADDYHLAGGSGAVENKTQFIADVVDPKFKQMPFTIEEPIHTVWSDGAVLAGLVHNKWLQDGKPGSVTMRFADMWAKRDGHWRVVYTEVTRLPKN
jgi:hypothetical protein